MRITRWLYTLLIAGLCSAAAAQTGFIENMGQWDEHVLYRAEFPEHTIFVDQSGFSVLLHDTEQWKQWMEEYHSENRQRNKHNRERVLHVQHVSFDFVGAHLASASTSRTSSAYYNYFIGNDASKWVHGARKHEVLLFKDVYPNIDLELIAEDLRFKYNFILRPGADINDIALLIEGANEVKLTDKKIDIDTDIGVFSEVMPLCYTVENGSRTTIGMQYIQQGETIGFSTDDPIGGAHTVIDPELVFSTYSGSVVDNFGFTATYDHDGNLYAGGIVASPLGAVGYPVTTGAFDVTFNGGSSWGRSPANLSCDISLSKYDSTGSQLIYATYLGGADDEYPHSLVVDDDGDLIVFGTTYSGNYPTLVTSPYNSNSGGIDIVVTKFKSDGSGIIGSTYMGGAQNDGLNSKSSTRYYYADDFRGEVNIDPQGNIYVAASTESVNFPVTSGSFQGTNAGGQDGVVFCLSPNIDRVIWSSYLGGSSTDAVYSIDVARNGDIYVSGGTSSTNLNTSPNAVRKSYQGGRADGYAALISNSGQELKELTYWGTSDYDQILSLEIDRFDNIFVVGHSTGSMPVTASKLYSNADGKQFITKFDPQLNNVLLSTVYGAGKSLPDITVNAFLVDECGKIFVSGWGGNINSGASQVLGGMPISDDAIQRTTDGHDFHLAVFRRDALELLYSTYFGGNLTQDHVDGGTSRFDKRGVIYQSVCSSCPPGSNGQTSQVSDFPTTSGAYSENNPSIRCSNASFKLAFGNLNRKPRMDEPIYHVRALDTLVFSYTIIDPDQDTILASFNYGQGLDDVFIQRPGQIEREERIDVQFTVKGLCDMIGDTILIQVYALDRGCPGEKDSTAYIRVVVDPPPLVDPPEVICLNFVGENGLRLEWETLADDAYFSRMYLYKVDPSGDTSIIRIINSSGPGVYLDNDVIDPREKNYTYFIRAENLCGMLGPKSYDLSSVKEHEIPVEATYLKTVTVEGKQLRIVWLRSTEEDFGHYEIYKGKRGDLKLSYLTSVTDINDTTFLDSEVDVDGQSYCYEIRVSDNCGHLSKYSNIGCSIVILGESIDDGPNTDPRFSFDLRWDEYIWWQGGVNHYELIRSVDTGTLRPIVSVTYPQHDYNDADLDFDWGGYWYSVIAHEGGGGHEAQSRSNDIYLIQPPLVFVPNAFTSNGDQLNDVFGWTDVFVRDFEMRVYNRWGEKVFQTTDKNAVWDGEFLDGGLNNSTVFIWVVEYIGWDNYLHVAKGTVTMVR